VRRGASPSSGSPAPSLSCFIPLTKYLFESDALGVIGGTGRQVTFHTVLTGGYGLRHTIAGFDWLAEKGPPPPGS